MELPKVPSATVGGVGQDMGISPLQNSAPLPSVSDSSNNLVPQSEFGATSQLLGDKFPSNNRTPNMNGADSSLNSHIPTSIAPSTPSSSNLDMTSNQSLDTAPKTVDMKPSSSTGLLSQAPGLGLPPTEQSAYPEFNTGNTSVPSYQSSSVDDMMPSQYPASVDGGLSVPDQNSDGIMNPTSVYDPSSVGTSSHHPHSLPPQSLGLSPFSHQQEMAALQQQLQEMYCMPPGPDHQEKVITYSPLIITFTLKLKVLDVVIRIELTEKVVFIFSGASVYLVAKRVIRSKTALKPD
jgi:chromodomain-helicase-DNA-binding protein 7